MTKNVYCTLIFVWTNLHLISFITQIRTALLWSWFEDAREVSLPVLIVREEKYSDLIWLTPTGIITQRHNYTTKHKPKHCLYVRLATASG